MDNRARTHREIARHSRVDAEAYDDFARAMLAISRSVKPMLGAPPPDLFARGLAPIRRLRDLGRRFRALSEDERRMQLQLLTMSAVDFLGQWFETDVLKATMAASGIIGTRLGVRSPGTAYVLLHHYMGEIDGAFRSWGLARGGRGAVSEAIAAAARAAGAEIRTSSPVDRVLLANGQAIGVVLENGDDLLASSVVSTVDARTTFFKMVGRDQLPGPFAEDLDRFKFRGTAGKVNLALDGLPDFTCKPGRGVHLRGAISISPGIDYMERAYDDAKYGRYSRRPYIDIVIPSLTDPTLAPPGRHVMSCFVQYAPYDLAGDGWDASRDAFGDAVIDAIAEFAPNLKQRILHRQVLTPLDLEREFGLTEGNIFQGELALEQMLCLRPVPGWSGYATPIRRLYLGGSSAHPGGGIMGAPGRNAARRVLVDVKR